MSLLKKLSVFVLWTALCAAAQQHLPAIQVDSLLAGKGVASDASTNDRQLAKPSGAQLVLATTADTNIPVFIIGSASPDRTLVYQDMAGQVDLCDFDGSVTAGHYVIASTTVGGKCKDSGVAAPLVAPSNTYVVGIAMATAAGVNTSLVLIAPYYGPPSSTGTSGTGFLMPFDGLSFAPQGGVQFIDSNNDIQVASFETKGPKTISSVCVYVGTGKPAATLDVGIYSFDKTTRLFHVTTPMDASVSNQFICGSGTPVTLNGLSSYKFAATCTDATVTFAVATNWTYTRPMMNGATNTNGLAGGISNGAGGSPGILPASLGTTQGNVSSSNLLGAVFKP